MPPVPIASIVPNAVGSSIEQNQKLRRSTSLGSRSLFQAPPSCPEPEWASTKSARSASIATQPSPPSSRVMFRRGKRTGMPDQSQSAHATRAFTENSVVIVSNGVSGAGIAAHWAEPVCRQTTVSVSSHAEPLRARDKGIHRKQRRDRLEWGVGRRDRRPLGGAGVQADDRLRLLARGEERIPHPGVQA